MNELWRRNGIASRDDRKVLLSFVFLENKCKMCNIIASSLPGKAHHAMELN